MELLEGLEFQEKKGEDEKHRGKLFRKNPKIKWVASDEPIVLFV